MLLWGWKTDIYIAQPYTIVECVSMMAGSSSLTGPESDWLDSRAGRGGIPVAHRAVSLHMLNQPSPHTLRERSPAWQHGELVSCIIVRKPYNKPAFIIIINTLCPWSWSLDCYKYIHNNKGK